MQHLENNKSRSQIMKSVYESEAEKCIRVGNELLVKFGTTPVQNEESRPLSQKHLAAINKKHLNE